MTNHPAFIRWFDAMFAVPREGREDFELMTPSRKFVNYPGHDRTRRSDVGLEVWTDDREFHSVVSSAWL